MNQPLASPERVIPALSQEIERFSPHLPFNEELLRSIINTQNYYGKNPPDFYELGRGYYPLRRYVSVLCVSLIYTSFYLFLFSKQI